MFFFKLFSAFEFMDNHAMAAVLENLGYTNPIGEHPFYVLVETSGSNDIHDAEVFRLLFFPIFICKHRKLLSLQVK